MIRLQFIKIDAFFKRIHLHVETETIRDGLQIVLVNIMSAMLKICGIAMSYAKTNSFKRSLLPIILCAQLTL